jgi:hypothetical protein
VGLIALGGLATLIRVKQGKSLVEEFLEITDSATLQEHVPVSASRSPRSILGSCGRALQCFRATAALPQHGDLLGFGREGHRRGVPSRAVEQHHDAIGGDHMIIVLVTRGT